MKKLVTRALIIVPMVVLFGVIVVGQTPTENVWVLQNPPFGSIASLAGFPELSSMFPMGGPVTIDVRLSERIVGAAGGFPSRFLRLTQTGDRVDASLYLWWYGQLGLYEPPVSIARRCTEPREGPRLCVFPGPSVDYDWQSVLGDVLAADACPASRPTDAYEFRVQVFQRVPYPRYRTSELCEPIAARLRVVLDALAPNDFRERK